MSDDTILMIAITVFFFFAMIFTSPTYIRWKYNRKEKRRVKEEKEYMREYYYDRLREQGYGRSI